VNLGLVTKLLGSLLVGGTAAGATWAFTEPVIAVPTPEARAWFDVPLAGEVVPVGTTVEIVAHATDADGVDVVELRVDGDEETTVTGGGASLVTVELAWDPPGAGTYQLEVRGLDEADHAGEPGVVTVTVGEAEDATTTTTAAPGSSSSTSSTDTSVTTDTTTTTAPSGPTTTRPGPTTTTPGATTTTSRSTTTTTSCARSAPTLVSPPNGSSTRAAPTLTWAYSGCEVDAFRVEVLDPDGADLGGPAAPDQRSWVPPGRFPCGGAGYPFTWRVGAVIGGVPVWSAQWAFTCG
jgi:hypothetical protein